MMYLLTEQMFTAAGTWDLGNFLKNSYKTLGNWFTLATMLVGLFCLGIAIWQIASGLMSHGKKQTNWAVSLILLLVGGVLSVSTGFGFIQTIASGGKQTIEDLGNGTGASANAIFIIDYFKWTFLK